ncbi:MAG: hypothetical protein K2H37_14075 [Lachnospiraceae bacterium]|nr:hypothetical protein [Lachnospiraceae bacterium]
MDVKQKYPLLHKTGEILLAAAGRITALAGKAETFPGRVPEIFALLFYAAAHLGMALVHEPFFDEAEAWQIARSVTLKTLLFETTHYEGHPPLWHLILMPLAKAGAPYELSRTLVSLAFMGAAVFLLLWYAPFPRLVRLLLPFTYFFFYQYGVISRVYCVMTLAFVLLAMAYRRRNEKPGRYVMVLVLLCVTQAYGLVFAGGLALVWLWEIWKEQPCGVTAEPGVGESGGQKFKKLVCRYGGDRRLRWLAVLLAVALIVIWMIMPRADTYAMVSATPETIRNPFVVRLIYTFFVLPADAMLTDIYSDHIILSQVLLMPSALVSGAFIGMLILGIISFYGRKKRTTLLFFLPYSLFAVFSAVAYFSLHHIGIGLLWMCFWCWVNAETGESVGCTARQSVSVRKCGACGRVVPDREMPEGDAEAVRCAAILLGTLAIGISLLWTGVACKLDIAKNYAPGRNEAAFIREHRLDQYRIMTGWMITYDEEGNVRMTDINQCNMAVNLAPYFEHNLFFNFNGGRDDGNYITHIHPSEEETQKQYEAWRKEGAPQVLWMQPDISAVYGGTVSMRDYALVYQQDAWQIWKTGASYYESDIHVRRDLLEETGLRPLQTAP